jgi:hypothetical protein
MPQTALMLHPLFEQKYGTKSDAQIPPPNGVGRSFYPSHPDESCHAQTTSVVVSVI